MSKTVHRIFIVLSVLFVTVIFVVLCYVGWSYYKLKIEDRYFHSLNKLLEPGGVLGHGYGIIGTLLIIIGVLGYMARKRYRWLSRTGNLKYWLEFHIFLCTIGPILVLFHTAFKFGGIVAISFWSMVAVFLSGIIGRFIYIQIPRTIEGRELSLTEVQNLKNEIIEIIKNSLNIDDESLNIILCSIDRKSRVQNKNILVRYFKMYLDDAKTVRSIKQILKKSNLPKTQYKKIIGLVQNELSLNRKIDRLVAMQNLFNYWHVAHLPFALVMLIIMVIHVIVTLTFGYKWIF